MSALCNRLRGGRLRGGTLLGAFAALVALAGSAQADGGATEADVEQDADATVVVTGVPAESKVAALVKSDIDALGSLSIGRPNGGRLLGAVTLGKDPRWEVVDADDTWGTQETVDAIVRAIDVVHDTHADTPPLYIGDISHKKGGPMAPHRSHQSGRDVDLGYYYQGGQGRWYTAATAARLDVARTWTLVRALIVETDVELILIDASVQRQLREHALSIGEDKKWIDDVFKGTPGKRQALIRHAPGHLTHLHVRFFNPVAQETARRAHAHLIDKGLLPKPVHYDSHKAKNGDTLGSLANRYKTTVKAIQQANGLSSTMIKRGQTYRIPKVSSAPTTGGPPVRLPPRRLPPNASSSAPKTAALSR